MTTTGLQLATYLSQLSASCQTGGEHQNATNDHGYRSGDAGTRKPSGAMAHHVDRYAYDEEQIHLLELLCAPVKHNAPTAKRDTQRPETYLNAAAPMMTPASRLSTT
jgi:hypothetical protein